MRKLIFAVAAMALVASACTKEQKTTDRLYFTASIQSLTKAQLGTPEDLNPGTFYPVEFVAGDAVAVKNLANDEIVKFIAVESGPVAKFVIAPTEDPTEYFEMENEDGYYLSYPYDSLATPTVSNKQVQAIGTAATGSICMESSITGSLFSAVSEFTVTSTLLNVVLDNPCKIDRIVFYDGNDTIELTTESNSLYSSFIFGVNSSADALPQSATLTVFGEDLGDQFYDEDEDEYYIQKNCGGKTLTPAKMITVKIHN